MGSQTATVSRLSCAPNETKLVDQSEIEIAFSTKENYGKILNEFPGAKVDRIALRWDDSGTGIPERGPLDYRREIRFGNDTVIYP